MGGFKGSKVQRCVCVCVWSVLKSILKDSLPVECHKASLRIELEPYKQPPPCFLQILDPGDSQFSMGIGGLSGASGKGSNRGGGVGEEKKKL